MPSWIMTVLFFAVAGVIYLVVSYIGNKKEKIENLSDRFYH